MTRAFKELETCGLTTKEDKEKIHIELRGDDSIVITSGAVDAALLFTAFCASGRPMEEIKQEIWSSECEYLRNKVTQYGCQGYINRNVGTLISAPFENTNKHDVIGRLEALCQQVATIHRRGANTRSCEMLLDLMTEYWGCYKFHSYFGDNITRMRSLPNDMLRGCRTDGGLDCNLLPKRQKTLRYLIGPAPRFSIIATRVTEDTPARGSADLASQLMAGVSSVLDCSGLRSVLASEIHEQATVGCALPSELAAAHREYEIRFTEWANYVKACEEHPNSELWFIRGDNRWCQNRARSVYVFWLVPETAWLAYYRERNWPDAEEDWIELQECVRVTFQKDKWLTRLIQGGGVGENTFGVVNPSFFSLKIRTIDGWRFYVLYQNEAFGPICISNQMNVLDTVAGALHRIPCKRTGGAGVVEWSDYICDQVIM
uniref:Reverse transcriptase n=1 Tax=Haemonchus contortus TaxID=6289 RepID=A0A7I4XY43_HAECO